MEVPKEIKKINEVTWEIPTSYKQGMNVPARIIATEKLLQQMDKGVFDQVTNVACLPGIVNYAYCMPDGHWGYGFPVGGLAAFDPEIGGVISPGGIGFDINCISGKSKIMTAYGSFLEIKDFEHHLNLETKSIDFSNCQEIRTQPLLFMKKFSQDLIRIETKAGHEIIATKDHPFYTPEGMKLAGTLTQNSALAVSPFEGVPHESMADNIILDKEHITSIEDRSSILKELHSKGLLPLKSNSLYLPVLAKLVGFLQGDGHISSYYNKKRKQNVWSTVVIGKEEDLITLKKDIEFLGYSSSSIQTKKYQSVVQEIDETKRNISGNSTQMRSNAQSLAFLLHALGVPKGNKTYASINVPLWIKESPLWIKRLYLAGLFGAELSKPQQDKKENYRFKEPSFSQNKVADFIPHLRIFLSDIKELLQEFGITCNKIYMQKGVINVRGDETIKLSLKLSSDIDNLINLWGKIGYEYCEERKKLSLLALHYLKLKRNTISRINKTLQECVILQTNGVEKTKIREHAFAHQISFSLLKKTLVQKNSSASRLLTFMSFSDFVLKYALPESGYFVWDEISAIEELEEIQEVYDFTINHKDHNFIANNFVISNCGMRLVTTNLTFKDVQPKLKELVDTLFKMVPAGVGAKGFVPVTRAQFKEVMEHGSKWCIENGYGWKEDLARTEGHGKIEWADSSKVSERAIVRGINQIGTLGSGNHYLEIQRVEEKNIVDKELAKKFGIFPDQIVVMVHCGSRGFGHQIATDYLQVFDKVMKEYNIVIRDRELSCAPFNTKEGQDYYRAMACAANMAFANRQVILHRIREGFSKVFNKTAEELEMHLVYDVAHNIAKLEEHKVNGKKKTLIVHRKGSTRAFPPLHSELDPIYQKIGQPVIIGGSMETGSFLLVGTQKAMDETFGSTCHGSGRTMSRTKARHDVRGDQLQKDMEKRGIYVRTVSMAGLAEEAGVAYKDINEVVKSVELAGISKPVVGLRPIGNVKG